MERSSLAINSIASGNDRIIAGVTLSASKARGNSDGTDSEGAMGGLDRYLNDLQTAQALLSPYTGKPITVNGQVVTANGAPQTYFGATSEQYGDPYANTLLGQLPGSIVAGMDQRDQLRLEQMIVQNGSATPIYPVEELLLGGAVGSSTSRAFKTAATTKANKPPAALA